MLNWDLKFIPLTKYNQTVIISSKFQSSGTILYLVISQVNSYGILAIIIYILLYCLNVLFSYTIIGNNSKSSDIGRLLIEYTGVSIPATYQHGKAKRGLYVISAQTTTGEDSKAMFYVGLNQNSQKNQFGFRPNGVKIKKGGQKIYLRWNLR